MANIYSLQLLRNGKLYANKSTAMDALKRNLANVQQDGVAVLARYRSTSDVEGEQIKTLIGYYTVYSAMTETGSLTAGTSMTVVDTEGYADDIDTIKTKLGTGVTTINTVTKQLSDLSGNTSSTSGETSVAGAKKYTDGKIAALTANSVANENKVITDVTQLDGKITATASNITGIKLEGIPGTADTKIASANTLGQALANLQGQINSLNLAVVSGDGEVITAVSENEGKVSASKTAIKDVVLTGYTLDTATTGAIASTDDIEAALNKLENKAAAITIGNDDGSIKVTTAVTGTNINVNIKSGEKVIAKDGNAGIYTNIAISAATEEDMASLGTNVKEAYKLVATNGDRLGEFIKIYKDSSLVNLYLGHVDDLLNGTTAQTEESSTSAVTPGSGSEALVWIVQLANGNYKLAAVDVEAFLQESEFKDGLVVSNHEVKVSADTASEKIITSYNDNGTSATTADVLTVSATGVKVSNIQAAIDAKVGTLDAVVTGGTIAGTATTGHIQVTVGEADGKLTGITVTETNVADKDKLEELSGKTFTVATSSNASITTAVTAATDGTKSVDLITDASKIKMSGFTAAESGFTTIAQSSSVTEAFKAVETIFIDNEEVVASALNDLNDKINELTSGTSSDLADEIATRERIEGQSGSAYTANSNKPYISDATSLNDADIKLSEALKSVADNYIEKVKVNNVELSESSNAVNVKISAGSTAANDVNAIHVDTDSSGAITLTLGTLDCGTYD